MIDSRFPIDRAEDEPGGHRRGAAFHESGHAVVAHALGLGVGEIVIGIDGDDAKGGAAIESDQLHLPVIDRLAICLAGLEAQELFRAPTHDHAGLADLGKVIEIIEGEGLDPSQPEGLGLRDAGYARARELIAANEDRCRRVAARLIEKGRIGSDEFLQLIHPPVIVKAYPEPREYEAAETAFFKTVGMCITQWAFIDRILFRMFRLGIGAPTHRAAILYYDQHTISQRLRQVHALLKSLFESPELEELQSEWRHLKGRIDDLIPTRNVIAHQPVRRVGTSDGAKTIYVYGIHVEPYQRYVKKSPKGMKGKAALEQEDLNEHCRTTEMLHDDLLKFAKTVLHRFQR